MRLVSNIILMFILCCGGGLLWADNIPMISESMHALGEVDSFVMYGDYALFIGGERHLQIMDFSDAQHPRMVAGCDVPGLNVAASSVSISGQYAYLFFWDCYAIISLSNPLSPQFMARIECNNIVCQSIHDGILYVAHDWDIYLYAYSLGDPLAPQLLDSLQVNNYPESIACGDGFLVCGHSTVDVVDTSDPSNLQINGELSFLSGIEYSSSAIAISGNKLAVGCGYYFSVYDLGQEPYQRATLYLGERVSGLKGYIHNNRFWSTYNEGHEIFGVDFSNFDALEICYSETIPYMVSSSFCVGGNITTLRVQYPHTMYYSVLADDPLPGFELSYPLDSVDRVVSQGDWTVGIISDAMHVLGFDETGTAFLQYCVGMNGSSDITLRNDTLLYTELGEPYQNGEPTRYLVLYDLKSKTQKARLELGSSDLGSEIALDGAKAYICDGDRGLYVVDISYVEQPVLLCQLQEGIRYQCAFAENGKLWVGSSYTIRCYDIGESTTPVFRYEIPLYTQTQNTLPYKLLMIDDYLYAISTNGYLVRVKPGSDGATAIDYYQTRYQINTSIAKLGDGLMVGSCDGVIVYSLNGAAHPEEVAFRDVERVADAYSIVLTSYAVNGDRIYVGRGKSLQVLDAALAIAFTHGYSSETDQKLRIYPNPGKGMIKVFCKLPASGEADLELYNLRGQKVFDKTIVSMEEGLNVVRMETMDNIGHKLGSGVYFVRIKQGNYSQTGKLTIVK